MVNKQWKSFEQIMEEFNTHFHQFIQSNAQGKLLKKIEYHLGWRNESLQISSKNHGKRSRPILCILFHLLFSDNYKKSFQIATALEIIHNFSLVFDDIQDHDFLRRGRPSVWSIWGEDEAINIGSSLQTLVHRSINQMASIMDPRSVLEISEYISISMLKLCEGQQLDIEMGKSKKDIPLTQYLDMIQKKTATLFEAATYLGAVSANADNHNQHLSKEFGKYIGMAFQLFNDAMGIWEEKEKDLDKFYSDLENRKKTYPIIYTYSNCDRTTEKNLIQEYYLGNPLSEKQIVSLNQLFNEKRALKATMEAGQDYLNLAFDLLWKIEGNKEITKVIEDWVTYVVNKQIEKLSRFEQKKELIPLLSKKQITHY